MSEYTLPQKGYPQHLRIGVTQTGTHGVTHTTTIGVSHTDRAVVETPFIRQRNIISTSC